MHQINERVPGERVEGGQCIYGHGCGGQSHNGQYTRRCGAGCGTEDGDAQQDLLEIDFLELREEVVDCDRVEVERGKHRQRGVILAGHAVLDDELVPSRSDGDHSRKTILLLWIEHGGCDGVSLLLRVGGGRGHAAAAPHGLSQVEATCVLQKATEGYEVAVPKGNGQACRMRVLSV